MAMQDHQATPAAPGHEAPPAGAHEGAAGAQHESGGLPQFDFQWWPGQIAWFLIVFFGVLVFMRLFAVPRVGGAIDQREARITGDIAEARRMKEEADAQAEAAQADMAKARAAAQKLAQEARAKAQAEIAARLSQEEAKLADASSEAESRIARSRDAAMAHIQEIAEETAQAIVQRLTGRAVTADELKTAQG
jgi:F-type H+-transporting ATPase subunit b